MKELTTYEIWNIAFSIFQLLATSCIGIYVWWQNRNKVTSSRFKEVEDRLAGFDTRLATAETKVQSMPVCGNHSRMEDTDKHINARLDSIGKLLAKIDGRLDGINRMVDLLTQNELSGGKG